jgi:quinol monooxygenase YgiN
MRAIFAAIVLAGLCASSWAQEKKEPDLATRLKSIKGPFTLIVHFKVKKGEEKTLVEAAKPCIEATRKEKGCVTYELHQDTEEPTKFTFFERWKSPKALQSHLKAEHTQKLLKEVGKIADGRSTLILAKSIEDKEE